MNARKRVLSMLLTATLLFSGLPVTAVATGTDSGAALGHSVTFDMPLNEFDETWFFLTEGVPVTDADLLAGVCAADENGEPVTVAVKDVDGLDMDNPAPKSVGYPNPPYVITYAAKHPVSGDVFTETRDCYVTAATGVPMTNNATAIEYLDHDGSTKTIAVGGATRLESDSGGSQTLTNGWYYVDGQNITTTDLTVSGDVKIILMDNCTLTSSGTGGNPGIKVKGSNSLTIYAQSTGSDMGALSATGGSVDTDVDVIGGAGIGGGYRDNGGTITISGGTVNATGGDSGAGIGGGGVGDGGTITISGGTVNATGGDSGAGIGGGNNDAGISGDNSGAGGTITISGSADVTATGGYRGAGIGGGNNGAGGTVTISGSADVTATGGYSGAGIGGGYRGNGGIVTISGGTVNATGGKGESYSTSAYGGGAGIGGGGGGDFRSIISYNSGASGDITISGDAVVTATGGDGDGSDETKKGNAGAGIGSGGAAGTVASGSLGAINITTTGTVIATGGAANGASAGANIGTGGTESGAGAQSGFLITATAGAGGSISPSGSTLLTSPTNSTTYTITPDTGYAIQQVLVDGVNDTDAVANGSYTFTNVTSDHTISAMFALIVYAPIITTTALSNGTVNEAYSETLTATGDTPITWMLDSGSLPDGLSLSRVGVISGTPRLAGTFNFTVKAENGVSPDATQALSIMISNAHVAPSITTTTLPNGTVNAAYNQTLTATGDTPITWTLGSGTLPDGLGLSSGGVISGTPTAAGTFNFTVKAENGVSPDATKVLRIMISNAPVTPVPPTITTTVLPNGTVNAAYNQTLTATGDTPITWTLDSGTLPDGLGLSSGGVISGTPTAAGTFDFTVKAANGVSPDATKALSIIISNAPVTPTPTPTPSGSSDGGGSSYTPTTPAPSGTTWLEPNSAGTLANNAQGGTAGTKSTGQYGVRANAWAKLAGQKYQHDTMDGNNVQVRLYIDEPGKLTKDMVVSGYVKGAEVDSVRKNYEKWFNNKVRVIHFDQQADWEQPVGVAARIDLAGMDDKNLYFYAYDKKANSYRRIEKPAYWIDKNGYLHFDTPYAGEIIISEGPLEKK